MLRKKGHDASRTASAAVSSRVFVVGFRADVVDRVTGDEGPGLHPLTNGCTRRRRQQQRAGNRSAYRNAPAVALRRQSAPNKLAMSDTGAHLFVGLDGAAAVARINLATFSVDLQFSLGVDGSSGPLLAHDLAVQPGNPNVLAVVRKPANSSATRGVGILNQACCGQGDHGLLYRDRDRVLGNAVPAVWIRRFQQHLRIQSPRGRRVRGHAPRLGLESLSGLLHHIRFDAGRRYGSDGRVIDPEERLLLGTFPLGGPFRALVAPNSASGVGTLRHPEFGNNAPVVLDVSTRRRSSKPTRTRSRAWWRPPRTPRSRAS